MTNTKSVVTTLRDQALVQQAALESLSMIETDANLKAEILDTVKTISDHIGALNHVLRLLD